MTQKRDSQRDEEPQGFWMGVSDLLAGLIFVFLIILTVFSIQFKKEQMEFVEAKATFPSKDKNLNNS